MALALLVASAAPACEKDDGGEAPPAVSPDAGALTADAASEAKQPAAGERVAVRVIHAVAGAGDLELKVDGLALEGAKQITPFKLAPVSVSIPAGRRVVTLSENRAEGAPVLLVKSDIEVMSPGPHILLLLGRKTSEKTVAEVEVRLVRDDQGAEIEGKADARLRVINAADSVPPIDVSLVAGEGRPVEHVNVGFGKGTAYRVLPAGTVGIEVRSGLDRTAPPLYVLQKATLNAGSSYAAILSREHRGRQGLQVWLVPSENEDTE